MDEINDFFNFSKPFKRETISAGYVDGRTVKTEPTTSQPKREHLGTEYVAEFRARENDKLSKAFSDLKEGRLPPAAATSNLNDLDSQCEEEDSKEFNDRKDGHRVRACDVPLHNLNLFVTS